MNLLKICFGWLKKSWTWLRWPAAIGILVYLFFVYHEQFYDLVQREIDYAYLALAFVLAGGSCWSEDRNCRFNLTMLFAWDLLVICSIMWHLAPPVGILSRLL